MTGPAKNMCIRAKSCRANYEDSDTAAVAWEPNETGPLIRPGAGILGQNPTSVGRVILTHVRRPRLKELPILLVITFLEQFGQKLT
jgi:hypothetical protein